MSSATPLVANTIDEVITHLETIIAESAQAGDRIGFFASLYHKVTVNVRDGVNSGQFNDNSRLAELDVLFANRFLYALYEWRKGNPVTQSWQVAFEAARSRSKLVLQHLLLGINAHINLDLGIAVVETANGSDLNALRADYLSINAILSSLSYSVINKLNIVSPFLSLLGFSGTKSNSMLVQFSIGNARDGSWGFAEDLSSKHEAERAAFIAGRDVEIADLARAIITHKGFMRFGLWLIHLFEWKNVRQIISVLHEYQKPYKSEIAAIKK